MQVIRIWTLEGIPAVFRFLRASGCGCRAGFRALCFGGFRAWQGLGLKWILNIKP